jgi:CheY-like chemotaxis protein
MNAPLSREAAQRFRDLDAETAERRMQAAAGQAVAWPIVDRIRVCAQGLKLAERLQLERLAAISQRRAPAIELLAPGQEHEADVFMIDAADNDARAWGRARPWLRQRAVVWLGRRRPDAGHMALVRPIQWATLPLLLAEAAQHAPPVSHDLVVREMPTGCGAAVMLMAAAGAAAQDLRDALQAGGVRVTLAHSAREGLAALHAAPYSAVLVCGSLPDLDDLGLSRRLERLAPRIGRVPVIRLLDQDGGWARFCARLAGFAEVLARPADRREWADLLARHGIVAGR